MFRKDQKNNGRDLKLSTFNKEEVSAQSPKFPYTTAVTALSKEISALEVDFNHFGEIRSLSTSAVTGLSKQSYLTNSDPALIARKFLALPLVKRAFGLQNIDLKLDKKNTFGFGHRLDFKQVAKVAGIKRAVAVYGGVISVSLDHFGRIFSVTSSLKRGRKPNKVGKIILPKEALAQAAKLFRLPIANSECHLVLSAHQGQLDFAYEITLASNEPRDIADYLVLAKTGQVIEEEYKLRESQNQSQIPARALLQTPDPGISLSPQVSKTVIDRLPHPQVLKNKYFEIYTGYPGKAVYAKSDGSYCYNLKDPEFAAVTTFIALSKQLELYLSLGMKIPAKTLLVYVNDPTVTDNAYFDHLSYELHIGIGTGLQHNGLKKQIAFDLSVINHEFGHNAIFLQTPSNDLPGFEGAALHEAISDVLGSLVMEYLAKIWWAKRVGTTFTSADVASDSRTIGKYVVPYHGIRTLKNKKRYPEDLTGEAHSDSLIISGALADFLVNIACLPDTILENQIKLFAKINLTALALVPTYNVTFKDMLRAFIVADQQETRGTYSKLIRQSFNEHGITLGAPLVWLSDNGLACSAPIAA